MSELTILKNIENEVLTCSTDINLLKEKIAEGQPVVFLINNENRACDTTFIRYALEIENDYTMTREEAQALLTEDYCKRVIARSKGLPLKILETERTLVRELCAGDIPELVSMYEEKMPFAGSIFDEAEDSYDFFGKYCRDVYEFYGYGIWGVFDRENQRFMGIAGFFPRLSEDEFSEAPDLEMGFVFSKWCRGRGYAYEACSALIEYAKKNITYGKIFAKINSENKIAVKFAERLGIGI